MSRNANVNWGTIRPTKPHELNLLPNQDGFEFIGFLRDGTRAECRVVRDADGSHHVEGANFDDLIGWRYPATLDNLLR